jgi:hypothetical protein
VTAPIDVFGAHGARRRRSGALALFALAWIAAPAAAETVPRQVPLPPGLASVWRVDGRSLDSRASTWSAVAFSTDGKLVGTTDDGGTRVYRASDGQLVRMFPAPFSTGQHSFALAISSTGQVALGRVGGIDVHPIEKNGEALRFYCTGVCGPVSALTFSPNGAWLAYQAARGRLERTPGRVDVVDLRVGARVAEVEASATRAGVMFAADGRTLLAANTTSVDDVGTFGLRAFSSAAEWRRTRDVAGAQVPSGSIGPFAFTERVAAYSREGRVELRDIATGALVWAQPFVAPSLDSAAEAGTADLELVAFAPRSEVLASYESPVDGAAAGAIVLRRVQDGSVVAMYDVVGVSALALAPDGESFAYSTGAGRAYTVLARVPR